MNAENISALAHHLVETHGAKAMVEAARKASLFETAGDKEQARLWRRVEAAVSELRGPKES